MHEHPYLAELANATSTGLLAEEMVFAVGRLIRGEAELSQDDRQILEEGRRLLRSAVDPSPGEAQPGLSQLSEPEGTLDTIRAVLMQAPDANVKSYVEALDAALGGIVDEERDPSAYEAELDKIRDLFATVGHLTLSRANRLTRSPQDQLEWPTSPAISNS